MVIMLSMGVQKGVAIWKRIAALSHSMRSVLSYYVYTFSKPKYFLYFDFYMRIRRGEALGKTIPAGSLSAKTKKQNLKT